MGGGSRGGGGQGVVEVKEVVGSGVVRVKG